MASSKDVLSFRSYFTEFEDSSDADIATVLNATDVFLDEAMWPNKKDFALARKYWAAHMLTLQLMQGSLKTSVAGVSLADVVLKTVRIGERHVGFEQRSAFANAEASAGPGEILQSTTMYGQLYLQLRSRNIIPVAIV